MHSPAIWIVDFGSQYTQLITRKIRELGYSSEIITVEESKKRFVAQTLPKVLILSGGPQSIFEDPNDYSFLFEAPHLPILGICYGMQILGKYFGGQVEKGKIGEYGHACVQWVPEQRLPNFPDHWNVWMSHADHVLRLPESFTLFLQSQNGISAAMKHNSRPIWGLQFHPEVHHSEKGADLLRFFFLQVARLEPDWSAKTIRDEILKQIQSIGNPFILCAFSGGVDSLMAATLVQQVHGNRLYCFFVDHGLLRPQDYKHIQLLREKTNLKIEIVSAQHTFYQALHGVSDPEMKRKIIGRTFIEIFEQKVHEFEHQHQITFEYLLQGTLYPDVIESKSPHQYGGKSATIKSHHNVGGLPERMKLKLLEPFRFLFKDEVRLLGKELGLPQEWLWRHPFPGPGTAIRVLGEIKPESLLKVQQSDQILLEELQRHNLYDQVWQAFTVLLPVHTVGVKGDARVYEEVICLRIVESTDGMTASWAPLPHDFLAQVSSRITNEVAGVTRVVYDITSKPPGTIEWE